MKEALKLAAVVGIVLAAALAFVHMQEGKGYGLKTGVAAPPIRLPSLQGGEVLDLGSLRGRVVIVNFWATWCPPCVAEMPSLERLHQALRGDGIAVIGVSVDQDLSELRRFVSNHGITFPILRDPGGATASGNYHTTGYPETFVIDPSGILKEQFIGPAEWDTPEALAHFRALARSLKTSPTR